MRRVVVLGATGLVGRELVQQLLTGQPTLMSGSDVPPADLVRIIVRRPSGITSDRLEERVVDFERPDEWTRLIEGEVLFSTMGTTLKTAGSQDAQWRVDHDYQLWAAQAAKQNGATHCVLISSTGANSRSSLFYPRMKGALEERVQQLAFSSLTIIRPSLLEGEREENRPGERWALKTLGKLPRALLPAALRPVPVRQVALACRRAADRQDSAPIEIWEAARVQRAGT